MDFPTTSSGNYISSRGALGLQISKDIAASQAQVVATALEGAQQIAANPPAPPAQAPAAAAAPGRIDIKV